MTFHSMAGASTTVAFNVKSAVAGSLPISTLHSVGLNARRDSKPALKQGAPVWSTPCAKIKSPPGVFRDEVGRMAVKGLALGALLENKAQAKTIRNAMRLLTDEAKEGAIAHFRNDDRRIYNQQSSITPSGNNISVREQQDTRLLAI